MDCNQSINREAGDKQKGIRFQKLRAVIRFLERVQSNPSGQVYCAVEFLEDSILFDGNSTAIFECEENKQYSSALSFNSEAIKNTIVAFIDLKLAHPLWGNTKLGVYASAELAEERINSEIRKKAGYTDGTKNYCILKKLAKGEKLCEEEIKICQAIILKEYDKQYSNSKSTGHKAALEKWSTDELFIFLKDIDWSISTETNDELETTAISSIRSCRYYYHRHEGLDSYILSRLLDEFEKRSHSKNPVDRLINTSDLQLIYNQVLGDGVANLIIEDKPIDPAANTWADIKKNDHRNLEQKILSISPDYPKRPLERLARRCVLAQSEANEFAREYVSLRRRILDICEEELEKINPKHNTLDQDQVDSAIDKLVHESYKLLQSLSKSYKYKIQDKETIKGAVLSLFDECYIAFDENDANRN